jgi:hypothetical protein
MTPWNPRSSSIQIRDQRAVSIERKEVTGDMDIRGLGESLRNTVDLFGLS